MLRFDINFVFTIINVLILFAVVKIFLIGRVHKILDARKAQVDEQYEEAAKKLEEADKSKQEYEESIKNIEEEKERRFTEARNQAKSEYDRLMEQAKKESDKIIETARKEAEEEGYFLRPRFSPGYGDFPLEFQRNIGDLLQMAKNIGITLTDSLLMMPSKSVTAVIGCSKTNSNCKEAGCEVCNKSATCAFRRI